MNGRLAAARSLFDELDVFHQMDGHALTSVHVNADYSELMLSFGNLFFLIAAIADDDTIAVTLASESLQHSINISHQAPWKDFIGQSAGWSWFIMNQQGYIDGVLLSFDGISPQICINVVASSLKIAKIEFMNNGEAK